MYAIGGTTNTGATSEVDAFDPATGTWSTVASLPEARAGAAAATGPDGRVYVLGGSDATFHLTGTLQVYDPATGRWTVQRSSERHRVNAGVAFGADGRLYAVGGTKSGVQRLASVERYDPHSNTFAPAAKLVAGRAYHATASIGGRIYIVGGQPGTQSAVRWLDALDTP